MPDLHPPQQLPTFLLLAQSELIELEPRVYACAFGIAQFYGDPGDANAPPPFNNLF